MASDHEEFLTELIRHIGATLEQYEYDNNILLKFDSEIDLEYDRTLSFKLADSLPDSEREEFETKEIKDER